MHTALRIAMLVEEGKKRIISSGDWLTAGELSELTAQTVDELKAKVYRLMCEGRIFAISYEGVDYFPTTLLTLTVATSQSQHLRLSLIY